MTFPWSYDPLQLPDGDDYTHYDVDEPPNDGPDSEGEDGDRGCDCPHEPGCTLGGKPSWWQRIKAWFS